MARYIDAEQFRGKHVVAEIDGKLNSVIPYADIVYAPTADVAPKSEVAREIFEEIYKTMNSVYASMQQSCVGMHGDNPETMRLIGKLEGVKHLGDEIAELKKKYTA